MLWVLGLGLALIFVRGFDVFGIIMIMENLLGVNLCICVLIASRR